MYYFWFYCDLGFLSNIARWGENIHWKHNAFRFCLLVILCAFFFIISELCKGFRILLFLVVLSMIYYVLPILHVVLSSLTLPLNLGLLDILPRKFLSILSFSFKLYVLGYHLLQVSFLLPLH